MAKRKRKSSIPRTPVEEALETPVEEAIEEPVVQEEEELQEEANAVEPPVEEEPQEEMEVSPAWEEQQKAAATEDQPQDDPDVQTIQEKDAYLGTALESAEAAEVAAEAAEESASKILEKEEQELLEHLETFAAYGDVTVVELSRFVGLSNTSYAKMLIDRYTSAGLVHRTWRDSKGRYALTPKGDAQLAALRQKMGL